MSEVVPPKKRKPKDKKEVTRSGQIIKERKGLARTNEPVKLPPKLTWLKQPNLITLLSGDLNALHLRILLAIIENVQDSIEQRINMIPYQQLSLFKDTMDNSKVLMSIPLKNFGVGPESYSQLKKALLDLATIPVQFDSKDPITGAECWVVTGLLRAYIPKEKYQRFVRIEMDLDVAKNFVNVEQGFTKYIKEIALQTESKYTTRMYLIISSWKDKGGFSITLDRFRKLFNLETKYPDYKDLYKRVIRPAYEELFERANCWFEVSESYVEGQRNPVKLNFKVIRATLTTKEKEYLIHHTKSVCNMMGHHLRLSEDQMRLITPHINISNVMTLYDKVTDLKEYVTKHKNQINNIPDYCAQSILNFLKPIDDE